ncbi:glycoside hydrolase family 18 protein [Moniliophthora roreri MCA 2997]|uniref:chitinase n=2 Tax=Moniliophthora roreri TaxID=221103 RepID=V2XQD0_MONRO|nr:glycoside hydrolase family 18 protein [Moniliophthora roreri MCA 2997]
MVLSFSRILSLLSVVSLVHLHAAQVMNRPEGYMTAPNILDVEANPEVHVIEKDAAGKVQMAYFTNWGIYARNFQPSDIDPTKLTHILYSFADVSAETGEIKLTDSWADEQKHYPGDSWNDERTNLYGCLKQLYLLKMANRNLKVMLSVGGWTYSQAGHFKFVTSPTSRDKFVQTAIQLIEDYGFDGVDIDYEYPETAQEGQGFADLLTSLRAALNDLAQRKGDTVPYQISAAVAAGYKRYVNLVIPQMNAALDHWNLMAYDYAGLWLTYADNQANLYGGERTNTNTDKAIKYYVASGADASKITMGMPLYGRAFENTDGIGEPYSGIGPGTWEAGIYSYNVLPLAGASVYENMTDVTSYSYDSAKKELVTYDTPNIVEAKTQYVNANGLAGTMFWELSSDKKGADNLVATAVSVLGPLDQTQNHISYPNSKWDNIRNNMGQNILSIRTPDSPFQIPMGLEVNQLEAAANPY